MDKKLKKVQKKPCFLLFVWLLFLLLPDTVSAGNFSFPNEAWTIQDVVNFIGLVRDFFVIAGILAVVSFLIIAGLGYFNAGGNQEKTRIAKRRLFMALIGTIIIVGTYAIVETIRVFLERKGQP